MKKVILKLEKKKTQNTLWSNLTSRGVSNDSLYFVIQYMCYSTCFQIFIMSCSTQFITQSTPRKSCSSQEHSTEKNCLVHCFEEKYYMTMDCRWVKLHGIPMISGGCRYMRLMISGGCRYIRSMSSDGSR